MLLGAHAENAEQSLALLPAYAYRLGASLVPATSSGLLKPVQVTLYGGI
jgi:hypothetical protein